MRLAFPLLFAALNLAPVESGADIMKDYLGNWTYEEKWQRSKERLAYSFSTETKRLADQTIHTVAYRMVGKKREKAFEEWLYPDGRAMQKQYERGRIDRTYGGKWSVKSGSLVFEFSLSSVQGEQDWVRGSIKRLTRDRWSGAATAAGGYSLGMSLERVVPAAVTQWLFERTATAVVPRGYVFSKGEFEGVLAHEFYPQKSNLASNSYGTFVFNSGVVAKMSLNAYVKNELKPWFRKRGHQFVRGSEKWNGSLSWSAETTYVEDKVNYRERVVVWPCKDGFIIGTVFGPTRDWNKQEFKQMLKVLDSVRIRLKRGS
jgi:hypothetical protein